MNGRRAFVIVLAVALALGCIGAWAEAPQAEEAPVAQAQPPIAEGNGWVLAADGKMTVTPEARLSYDNHDDMAWYPYMDRILSLEVEEGVRSIGTYAFNNAINLRRVHLPEGIESIDLRAFSHCEKLQALALPDSLKRIEYWAFSGCDALEQIVVGGEGMRQLDNYAFQGCDGLLRAVIQEPIERLGYDVLEDCAAMKELYLPASLTLIDQYALRGCDALTDIYYAGSEAQWQRVQVENGNEEAIARATVHFDSAWDPQTAADVSTLRSEYPRQMWIRLWGVLQLDYAAEDYYGLVKGDLDDRDALLAEADVDKATMEAFFEENHDECLLIPRGQTFYDANYYCIAKVGRTPFDADATLTSLRQEQPDALDAYFKNISEGMQLDELIGYVEYGGMEFIQYRRTTSMLDFTIQNGSVFALIFSWADGREAPGMVMEADIMDAVSLYAEQPEATPGEDAPIEDAGTEREYTFMDGKLTLQFDPAEYDVYTQDNSDMTEVLERQGLTQAQMDMYMQGLGYQLMAVPAGESFLDCDWRFLLHVKAPKYDDIKNLKDFGTAYEKFLCGTIVRGFGVSQWDLVQTDAVDYFVFEALNSVRYATIVDERMIYLYITAEKGSVTDEQREALRAIMEGVHWNLD